MQLGKQIKRMKHIDTLEGMDNPLLYCSLVQWQNGGLLSPIPQFNSERSSFLESVQQVITLVGAIYIITNDVNNKVYIGQTVQLLERRFRQHVASAIYCKAMDKFHSAMRQIGIEHFTIRELERIQFSGDELQQLESDYINEYNSISQGYNQVIPAGSRDYFDIIDYCGDAVVYDFLSGVSYNEIAYKYKISRLCVAGIIRRYRLDKVDVLHNIKNNVGQVGEHSKSNNRKRRIVMYNTDFVPIGNFQQIIEAIEYLRLNTSFSIDQRNGYTYLSHAALNGNIAYECRWQFYDDLKLGQETIFRTKFDKENFESGHGKIVRFGKYAICGDIQRVIRVGGYRRLRTEVNQSEQILRLSNIDKNLDIDDDRVKGQDTDLQWIKSYKWVPIIQLRTLTTKELANKYGCSPSGLRQALRRFDIKYNGIRDIQETEFLDYVDKLKSN